MYCRTTTGGPFPCNLAVFPHEPLGLVGVYDGQLATAKARPLEYETNGDVIIAPTTGNFQMRQIGTAVFETQTAHITITINLAHSIQALDALVDNDLPQFLDKLSGMHLTNGSYAKYTAGRALDQFQAIHSTLRERRFMVKDTLIKLSVNANKNKVSYRQKRGWLTAVGAIFGSVVSAVSMGFGIYNSISIADLNRRLEKQAHTQALTNMKINHLTADVAANAEAISMTLAHQNKLFNTVSSLSKVVEINAMTTTTFAAVDALHMAADEMISSLNMVLAHRVPISLLTPAQAEDQLKAITKQAARVHRTPIFKDPMAVYATHADYFSHGNTLMIVVEIPLKNTKKTSPYSTMYKVNKPDEQMVWLNNTLWKFQPTQVVLAPENGKFDTITMTNKDLDNCKSSTSITVCPRHVLNSARTCAKNIHSNTTIGRCAAQMVPLDRTKAQFLKISSTEVQLFAPETMDLKYTCGVDKERSFRFPVKGLLQTEIKGHNCEIQFGHFTYATSEPLDFHYKVSKHQILKLAPESFDISFNISSKLNKLINTNNEQINTTSVTLADLKSLKTMTVQDFVTNHPAVMYFTLITSAFTCCVAMALLVACAINMWKKGQIRSHQQDFPTKETPTVVLPVAQAIVASPSAPASMSLAPPPMQLSLKNPPTYY